MENVKSLIDELRKRGLSNGSSVGYHSGLMDEAAKECIEKVKTEIKSWAYNLECYSDKREALERLDNLLKEFKKEREK